MLSTVSPRYAREIQTPENGYGLDWLVRQRSGRLVGITNGVDYEVWNPARDPELPANYSAEAPENKTICKEALLKEFGLPVDLSRPLFASITRLTAQKGFELIESVIGEILSTDAYFIALGSGERYHEEFLQRLRDHAPRQVGVYIGYNESLAHRIEAGADIFLMPSRFEPCGLNQMYSLRYGTVPVVRAVGGLDDTVQNYDAVNRTGNGFKFGRFRSDLFLEKIYEAVFAYADGDMWRQIQHNGMRENNSWEHAARKYVELYKWTLG
jgi:starch synthase